MNVTQKLRFILQWIENTVGKRETADSYNALNVLHISLKYQLQHHIKQEWNSYINIKACVTISE